MIDLSINARRMLAAHFVYLDELLEKINTACGSARIGRLFCRFEVDLTAKEIADVQERIAKVREELDAFGSSWGIELPVQQVLSSRALSVDIQFLSIALDDMSPRALEGYGELDPRFVEDYSRFLDNLRELLRGMKAASSEQPNQE